MTDSALPRSTMMIRRADLAHLTAIVALDAAYSTDFVWQLTARDGASDMSASFKLSPLPRTVKTPPPFDAEVLKRVLNRCDHLWVMHGNDARDVLGYIGMATIPWQSVGWVPCLAVAPASRRLGIASKLLGAAKAQAKSDGLHSIVMDVPTKNYPATRLCQRNGFRFAGYSDHYYPAREIALFFAYRV